MSEAGFLGADGGGRIKCGDRNDEIKLGGSQVVSRGRPEPGSRGDWRPKLIAAAPAGGRSKIHAPTESRSARSTATGMPRMRAGSARCFCTSENPERHSWFSSAGGVVPDLQSLHGMTIHEPGGPLMAAIR
jgi:hypothetical protein